MAAGYNENPDVTRLFVEAGANLAQRGSSGATPLHRAAMINENAAVAQLLVDLGADVFAKRRGGNAPIDDAVESNENPAVAQVLRNAMAKAEARPSTGTKQDRGRGLGALLTGAAVAGAVAAGGGETEAAVGAGLATAEEILAVQETNQASVQALKRSEGTSGNLASGSQCLVPGYPRPNNVEALGFSTCPVRPGDFQHRVFVLTAAGAQCAIALGNSSTPEQIQSRRQEIRENCARAEALNASPSGGGCTCPPELIRDGQ